MNEIFDNKFNFNALSYLKSEQKQKQVYHRTSTQQSYRSNINADIELPSLQPITLKQTIKPQIPTSKYHQSTIQELLINVNDETGWTESNISVFRGLWQLETIKDYEQTQKQSRIEKIHECNNTSCVVCYIQLRMADQSRYHETESKNDCFSHNYTSKVRTTPHTRTLCSQFLINHELHNRDYMNTYDPTLNASVDYSFAGLRNKNESILE